MIWPKFSLEEIKLVKKILKSGKVNYWTGQYVQKFEKKFANFHSLKYCVGVANASLGLEAALIALGVKKNDEVVTTPRSYNSSASCILRVNAKPVFCDINIKTQNIDIQKLKKCITKNTKVIICVHLGGYPCEMDKIVNLAKKNNLYIIEDCSQAHGAIYKNKIVGTFGDISVWSFCNDKIISTLGEGGMIGTNKKSLFENLWSIKEIGKNYKKSFKGKKPYFQWIHDYVGTNMRITEIQCASGLIQLKKIKKNLEIRRKIANSFRKKISLLEAFENFELKKNIKPSYYRFYFMINPKKIKKKWSREKILKYLNRKKLPFDTGSCPEIYKEKPFQNIKNYKALKNAKYIGNYSIAFKLNHLQSISYVNKILKELNKLNNKILN